MSVELGPVKNTLKQGKVFYMLNIDGHRKLGNSWNIKYLKEYEPLRMVTLWWIPGKVKL